MKSYPRTQRVGDQIQRELAQLISTELKDPRIGMVTITDVDVSPDYSHAKVFVTTLGGAATHEEVLRGLRRAAGFLRSMLGKRLTTRGVPELRFVFDASVERGAQLSQLIDQAVAEDEARGKSDE